MVKCSQADSASPSELFLKFYLGDEAYVLPARSVEVIVPAIPFRYLDHAPTYVAGLMDYQGRAVPVIDLCQLCLGRPAASLYSSRVMLVHYPVHGRTVLLGLLAEQVIDLVRCSPQEFRSLELTLAQSRLTREVAHLERQMVARVRLDQLLSPEVRDLLFASAVER